MKQQLDIKKLIQYNNITKDLLFWIKHFLVFKLSTIDKSNIEDDFDVSYYFQQIKQCRDIKCVKKLALEIKKQLGSFYNLTISLESFYLFTGQMNLNNITEITNSIFYEDFLGKELDGVSQSRKITFKSAVKQLFDYIDEYNSYYEDGKPYVFNITKDSNGKSVSLSRLKQHRKVPVFLNQEELEKLNKSIMTCNDFVKVNYEFQRAKDVLIMKILIYSGITSSELVNLRLSDIQEVVSNNKKYLQFNIHDSNLSDRLIPISNINIIRYFNGYLKLRESQEHDYLFYDKADINKRLRTQYVLNTVKKFFKCAKISKPKITAEVLRNTFGITLHNLGSPEKYTRELMGYKTPQMFKELIKYADKELIKASNVFESVDKL